MIHFSSNKEIVHCAVIFFMDKIIPLKPEVKFRFLRIKIIAILQLQLLPASGESYGLNSTIN